MKSWSTGTPSCAGRLAWHAPRFIVSVSLAFMGCSAEERLPPIPGDASEQDSDCVVDGECSLIGATGDALETGHTDSKASSDATAEADGSSESGTDLAIDGTTGGIADTGPADRSVVDLDADDSIPDASSDATGSVREAQPVCDAISCPNGCCNTRGACVPYASQTDTECGTRGASCVTCTTGIAQCNTTAGICEGCGSATIILETVTGTQATQSDRFGASVAVSGDTMLVAAPGAFGTGEVFVFSRSVASWVYSGVMTPTTSSTDYAKAIAISTGAAVVAGTPDSVATNWVFARNGVNWFWRGDAIAAPSGMFPSLALSGSTYIAGGTTSATIYLVTGGQAQATLTAPSDFPASDTFRSFGSEVAISGDTALVLGSPLDSSGQVARWVYVFVRSGSTWTQQAKLVPSDLASNNDPHFHISLAIDGNTAVVATSLGAYVFARSGTTWTETQKLLPPVPDSNFANSVALQGNLMVIGAANTSGGFGETFVFGRSNSSWIAGPTLLSTSQIPADEFGTSVAIDNGTVVVGAPGALNENNTRVGGVYVYSCAK